jgi:anti-sigma B factor antagonist
VDDTDVQRRRRISGTRPSIWRFRVSIDQSLVNRVRATLTQSGGRFARPVVEPAAAGPRTVLAVTGEIDLASSPQLRAAVEAAFASADELCIDLTETEFMDSTGLHVLVDAARHADEVGCNLEIVCPPGHVRRVIELAGVDQLVPLTSSA